MTQTIEVPKGPQAVSETLERYCLQRPQLEAVLQPFKPLLEERARLAESLASREIDLHWLDMARLEPGNQGVPLLSGAPLDFLASWVELAAETMLPVLQRAMPHADRLTAVASAIEENSIDLLPCCEYLLAQDHTALEKVAQEAKLDPAILRFALEQILAPAVAAMAARLRQKLTETGWRQGFCPVCGTFPSIATLSKPEPIDLDSLVGGGGKKFLHCSLCGHDWHFRRDACPACENADPGTREMLHAQKARQERIEACTRCKAYFLCIDLREYSQDPDLSVAPLGLMHLDVIAAQKGYVPLAPAPWNTFEVSKERH